MSDTPGKRGDVTTLWQVNRSSGVLQAASAMSTCPSPSLSSPSEHVGSPSGPSMMGVTLVSPFGATATKVSETVKPWLAGAPSAAKEASSGRVGTTPGNVALQNAGSGL